MPKAGFLPASKNDEDFFKNVNKGKGVDGIEPTTSRSVVECSTSELHSHRKRCQRLLPNGQFLYIFKR